MTRRRLLLLALPLTLAACGASPATLPPATPPTARAITPAVATPAGTSPAATATRAVATGGATRTVAATATRRAGSPSPSAPPSDPAGAAGPLNLVYRGREYNAFWFRPDLPGAPDPFAGLGVPGPGATLGETFSRWQSNNLAPAGAAIFAVEGQTPERMLALRADDGLVFYRAADTPADLPRTTVLRGTVRQQGPPRWDTADGRAPAAGGDAIYYAPLAVEVGAALHGPLVAEFGATEIRQFLPPGSPGDEDRAMFGELAEFAPGEELILFLWLGGEPERGGTPGTIARWFHWTTPNRIYRLRDGAVTPGGIPSDAGRPGVPAAAFFAGIEEAFRGVIAVDPRNEPRDPPRPIDPPPPSPLPPSVEVGQAVNVARAYDLAGAEYILVSGAAVPGGRYPILEAGHRAALFGALDRPATVAEILPQRTGSPGEGPTIALLGFRVGRREFATLAFDHAAGMLECFDAHSRRYRLSAPPELASLLGLA